MVSRSVGHLSESILVSWGYTEKVKIFEFLVDFDPTGTPAGGGVQPDRYPRVAV